jgi:hypothetical protein
MRIVRSPTSSRSGISLPSKAAVTAESACLENDASLPVHQVESTNVAQSWLDRRLVVCGNRKQGNGNINRVETDPK